MATPPARKFTGDYVRRVVDDDPSGGRFLLTGSPPGPGTHSGAGRIATVRMRPLPLFERFEITPAVSITRLLAGERGFPNARSPFRLDDYVNEIVAGGFPGMRHLTGRALGQQLDGYLDRIVDHDLPEAGFTIRRPETVRSWMRAYAAATATTASWQTIRDAATGGIVDKPARRTTAVHTDLLTTLRILDPIPPGGRPVITCPASPARPNTTLSTRPSAHDSSTGQRTISLPSTDRPHPRARRRPARHRGEALPQRKRVHGPASPLARQDPRRRSDRHDRHHHRTRPIGAMTVSPSSPWVSSAREPPQHRPDHEDGSVREPHDEFPGSGAVGRQTGLGDARRVKRGQPPPDRHLVAMEGLVLLGYRA
jgi:hypothetical protein